MKVRGWAAWQGAMNPARDPHLFQSLALQILGNGSLAWGARESSGVRKNPEELFQARLKESVFTRLPLWAAQDSGGVNGSETIRGEPSPQCDRQRAQ